MNSNWDAKGNLTPKPVSPAVFLSFLPPGHPDFKVFNLVKIGQRLCRWKQQDDPRAEPLRDALQKVLGVPVDFAMPTNGQS